MRSIGLFTGWANILVCCKIKAQLMAERFKYEKRYHYPHMKPNDIEIWERCIAAHPRLLDFVEYDVEVGSGAPFDPIVNDQTNGDVNSLYKRKIDVVGYKGEDIYIIEIKPNAGTSAIGQVKGYKRLFERDFPEQKVTAPVIVTDRMSHDVQFIADEEKVLMMYV